MILGKSYTLVPLLFCLSSVGCSFHSNQFEALKTIFREDSGPKPQWVFSWGEMTEKVFAVNSGSSIFFANSDGVLVHFNGAYVEKVDGLKLNSKVTLDISITKMEVDGAEVFRYSGPTSNLGSLLCHAPKETASDLGLEIGSMKIIEITQKCFVNERVLEQSIILNQTRQLMALQFFIHPERLPVTIHYGQLKELFL